MIPDDMFDDNKPYTIDFINNGKTILKGKVLNKKTALQYYIAWLKNSQLPSIQKEQ